MSKLDETLGIRPLEEVEEKTTAIAELKEGATTDEDLEFVRQNIHGLISNGNEAMEEMLRYAKQSESARAFEVVSTLIKTLLDANKDYVDLAMKKEGLKDKENGEGKGPSTVNNHLVLSTDDLLEKLLEKKKQNEE